MTVSLTTWRGLARTVAFLLGIAAPAKAANLEFLPILIEFPTGPATKTLEVRSRGENTVAIQVRAFAWSQTPTSDEMAPTSDLIVSPPIFHLAGGETQVVRLLLRARPSDTERAYRIVVDEIPNPGAGGVVRMALRVSLPAFAAPSGAAAPQLLWRVEREGGQMQIVATNAGRKRSRVDELTVSLLGGRRIAPRLVGQLPYVLPGAERRWMLEGAGLSSLPGGPLRVSARVDAGPLEDVVPVAGR